ncbi:MAG: hypothetical protein KDJ26_06220 [Alphaproteobacteria bacterium]|nr:hypothetical protein [Alphaproteobacteria bacterium]MCB9984173.1 hypothetical protein [Micavibrio sp.]HPQ50664.1 hypothetical protein [Alphaproteobacteria bacterium]
MSEKLIPTAKVVDGILILSLPDAMSPVVWQMEIGQSKSSALEVRPHEDGNIFSLILKTPKQDILEIARYNSRDHAVRALMTVSSAMEKAQGQIRLASLASNSSGRQYGTPYDYSVPALRATSQDSGRLKTYVIKPMAYISSALVLFIILFLITSSLISMFAGIDRTSSSSVPSAGSSTQNTPISAEDFLEGR